MGLFGGGNSSSTQLTTQNDNRNVLGQGATLAQAGASIYQTTLDADVANSAINAIADVSIQNLNRSLDFGGDALSGALSFGRSALDAVKTGENRVLDSLQQSNEMVKDAYADAKGRGAMTDKITIGAILVVGLVAVFAVKGKV